MESPSRTSGKFSTSIYGINLNYKIILHVKGARNKKIGLDKKTTWSNFNKLPKKSGTYMARYKRTRLQPWKTRIGNVGVEDDKSFLVHLHCNTKKKRKYVQKICK